MTRKFRVHFDGHVLVPDEPVDLPRNTPLEIELRVVEAPTSGQRKPGWGKGIIESVSKDFDAPLEDFKDYM